jgi:hypothetical protein
VEKQPPVFAAPQHVRQLAAGRAGTYGLAPTNCQLPQRGFIQGECEYAQA